MPSSEVSTMAARWAWSSSAERTGAGVAGRLFIDEDSRVKKPWDAAAGRGRSASTGPVTGSMLEGGASVCKGRIVSELGGIAQAAGEGRGPIAARGRPGEADE